MGGKSKSKTSSSTSYSNTDKRAVADNGAVALTGDGNSVVMTDQGAIRASADIVKSALTTLEHGDAVNGDGFGKLIDLAGALFEGAGGYVDRAQSLAENAQAGALQTAAELKSGTIDNKTIMVVAVVGLFAWGMRKK